MASLTRNRFFAFLVRQFFFLNRTCPILDFFQQNLSEEAIGNFVSEETGEWHRYAGGWIGCAHDRRASWMDLAYFWELSWGRERGATPDAERQGRGSVQWLARDTKATGNARPLLPCPFLFPGLVSFASCLRSFFLVHLLRMRPCHRYEFQFICSLDSIQLQQQLSTFLSFLFLFALIFYKVLWLWLLNSPVQWSDYRMYISNKFVRYKRRDSKELNR